MKRARSFHSPIQFLSAAILVCALSACDEASADEPETADPASDRQALREALNCWARGMDLTIAGLGDEGQAEFESCYAGSEYAFTILFRGQEIEGSGAMGRRMTNVETAGLFGYEAAQHYVSNLDIDIDGDTARVVALQKADHFLPNLTVETTWGVITVDFVREPSGWRATHELMDIQRFVAFNGIEAPSAAPIPGGEE